MIVSIRNFIKMKDQTGVQYVTLLWRSFCLFIRKLNISGIEYKKDAKISI